MYARHVALTILLVIGSLIVRSQPGTADPTFDPGAGPDGDVYDIAIMSNGQMVIVGAFNNYGGVPRKYVARVNTDGSLDPSFDPGTGPNEAPRCVALNGDGSAVYIAGGFISVNGISRKGIACLNSNGTLNSLFDPGTGIAAFSSPSVRALRWLSTGKILIGGQFTSYNGTARQGIARLNANGTLDTGFDPGTGVAGVVYCMDLDQVGNIYLGGSFTSINGVQAGNIACLTSTGAVSSSFAHGIGFDGAVMAMDVGTTGYMVVSGYFYSYNGQANNGQGLINQLALLSTSGTILPAQTLSGLWASLTWIAEDVAIQADGRIVLAGIFRSSNSDTGQGWCVVRLGSDFGSDAFSAGTPNAAGGWYGRALAITSTGKIVVGGTFTSYDGIARKNLVRINLQAPPISTRVMLEGPYNGTTMNDALRTLPSFPSTTPFPAMGYSNTNYVSSAALPASMLNVTGNNAIVDWVIVEMRYPGSPFSAAATEAFVQRDGDVVDRLGNVIQFPDLWRGTYCMVVRPRNHLPAMMATATPLVFNGAQTQAVDFTLPTTSLYDEDARKNINGVMVLAAGDVTFNATVKYSGTGNDRDPILTRVGSATPNNTVSGYWREDVNMDGVVKYTGSANDRDIILTNVGSTTPNNSRVATLP